MNIKKHFPTLLAIITLLILWQVISVLIGFPRIFPGIPEMTLALWKLFSSTDFYSSLGATVVRGMIGFFISFVLAFILSLSANFHPFLKQFLKPFLVVIRSIPVISLVLIALLWFSPNGLPIFIALLTMFPILYQNMLSGFEQVDVKLVEMAKVFGRKRLALIHEIYFPSARKIIFAGMGTALGFGWRAIIIGEVLAQPLQGIGSKMKYAQAYINVPELIAWTFVAILVSFFFEYLIKLLSQQEFYKLRIWRREKTKHVQHFNYEKSKTLSLDKIEKSYSNKKIIHNLSYEFNNDKIWLLKAPSGVGKTTLLRLLAGVSKVDFGVISKDNIHSVAFSFQDVRLLPWLTIRENIAFAYGNHLHIDNNQNKELEYLLKNIELSDNANHYPHELSGGQQQRVELARALAAKSDILLLDEPLNGLDDELKLRIINLIADYTNTYKPLIIWATHENISTEKLRTDVFNLLP